MLNIGGATELLCQKILLRRYSLYNKKYIFFRIRNGRTIKTINVNI